MMSIVSSTRCEPGKKQLDYVMGPKDIRSTTWYLNRVRFRTWDHFPVITRIEGRELKTKNPIKGWAGWVPCQKQRRKFQEIVLCPRSEHGEGDQRETEEGNRLALQHERLVGAAPEVKATTTSSQENGLEKERRSGGVRSHENNAHAYIIDACVSKSSCSRCEVYGRVGRRLIVHLSSCTRFLRRTCTCTTSSPAYSGWSKRATRGYQSGYDDRSRQ